MDGKLTDQVCFDVAHSCLSASRNEKVSSECASQVSDDGKMEEVLATDVSLDAAVFVFCNFHL